MRDVLSTRHVNERVIHTVELLTSEVVTNAILHAECPCVLVVRITRGRVRVEVQDTSRAMPVRRKPSPLAASGRGMTIVDKLAKDWGVDHLPGGKRVWFEVPFSAPPLPDWVRQQAALARRADV